MIRSFINLCQTVQTALQSLSSRPSQPSGRHRNTLVLLSERFFRAVWWHKSWYICWIPWAEGGLTNAESAAGYHPVWAEQRSRAAGRLFFFFFLESLFRGPVKRKMQTYFLQDCRISWKFQLRGSVHFIYPFYLLRLFMSHAPSAWWKRSWNLPQVCLPPWKRLHKLWNEDIHAAALGGECDLCRVFISFK